MVERHPAKPVRAPHQAPRTAAPAGIVEIGLEEAASRRRREQPLAVAEAIAPDAFARRHLPEVAAGTPAEALGGVLGEEPLGQPPVAVD